MQRSAVRNRRSTAINPSQGSLFDLTGDEPDETPPAPAPVITVVPLAPAVRHVYCDCGGQPGHHKPACAINAAQQPASAPDLGPTVPSGAVSRIKANLRAIAVLRALEQEKRPANPAEVSDLAAWSGWGAVPEMFDPARKSLDWAREQLALMLDEQEIAAAARSTLNAHYTDPRIVQAMWEAVTGLGFTGGVVLEPGCGSGNFLATAPAGAKMVGVELDPTTAAIARARCDFQVIAKSFADVRLPDGMFDLTVGNVPFAKVTLHDKVHNKGQHSIHNHFIIKALHLTRPGGLVAVLTSRYTLDATDSAARREIHALADLVTANRLPTDAHLRNAGTRVVMDMLILRRRETGQSPVDDEWLDTVTLDLDGQQVAVNQVFADGDGVLGQMRATTGAYRAGDLSVVAADGTDWLDDLRRSLTTAAAWSPLRWTPRPGSAPPPVITLPVTPVPATPEPAPEPKPAPVTLVQPEPEPEPEPQPDAQDVQDGHIFRRPNGTFARAENGIWADHKAPATQAKELTALLALRDAALAVLRAETANTADTSQLDTLRSRLRGAYDQYTARYGHLNRITERRTGRTHPETGDEIMARVRPPMGGFRADPYAPLVFALEDYDPESDTADPAPILTRRVIVPREPATKADTPADALAVCLDTVGRVDIDVIARLLSTTPDKARAMLGPLVFDDPDDDSLHTAAEYLSGDVRAKLRAAQAAAADDNAYEANVTALREVQPSDLGPGEIDARLGAAWISAGLVQQFLRELLEASWIDVEHPGGQVWHVEGPRYGVLSQSTWGTKRYAACDLAQTLLEQRRVEVKDCVSRNPDRYVLNLEETAAAMEKADELQERFTEWLWADTERARALVRIYNDRFNSIVLRSYDGARLTLPGLSATLTLRDHQHAAVARIISEPAVLLGHDVGAGKTLEMICGAMELRRLGLVRKPCVVVPNHMLDQFAGEWLRAYPLAKILITRQEDLQGSDNRRRLVARVATGDWDAVIMSSSAFERIPLTPRAQAAYLERETDQLRDWLANAKQGKGRTIKRLEAALLRAVERVKAKLDSKKDPGIHFEDTGIDYLCVDEAHRYKNLRTASAIQGAAIDGSQRASDLDMKIDWLRKRNGDRVVTYATATPVANSITEIYVMNRYLRPDLLEAAGVEVFDTWAATFGKLVTEVELAPEGGGTFRLNTRFARFRNVPELLRMFHVFADIKTAEDLDLPTPLLAAREDGKRTAQTITVSPSETLRAYVSHLGDRATAIRNREVKPDEDNMLKVSGDGRAAALDLRLVHLPEELADLPRDEPAEIAAAAYEIHQRWLANRDRTYLDPSGQQSPIKGSLQLVFCDLGTPRPAAWSAYRELRDQLVLLGVPAGMVRFMHDAKTDRDKARLFAAARSGNVAVLVGSTEKMGVGTNVQARAIALHHLDAPWRPADVAQRDGRIMRQGNLNAEVEIIRYVVEGSFDGYMWQTLERKAKFIAAVMRGRLDVREIEDIGDTALSYAEVKALATGNPLLMEMAKANSALATLQRAERAHNRNQAHLESTIRDLTASAERLRDEAVDTERAVEARQDTTGDLFTMTVDGVKYDRRADAAPALADSIRLLVRKARDLYTHGAGIGGTVGELGGFAVQVKIWVYGEVSIDVWLEGAPGCRTNPSASEARNGLGLIARLEHRLHGLEEHQARLLDRADGYDVEVTRAAEAVGAPFARAAELAVAAAEMARVTAALDAMARQQDAARQGEKAA